jgi:hypothetical protein
MTHETNSKVKLYGVIAFKSFLDKIVEFDQE